MLGEQGWMEYLRFQLLLILRSNFMNLQNNLKFMFDCLHQSLL